MPEVLINGEKKKVACGPCIRGHRSSKCTHKDRVLIEVRKPGRPLSACPHPAGSCSCERVVINYTIPKTSDCPCPPPSSGSPAAAAAKVQKPRTRKPSITPSNLQKVIDGDAAILSQTNIQPAATAPSETSSNGPSISSSTSSTPRTDPIDSRNGSSTATTFSAHSLNDGGRPGSRGLQLGMMGIGGFGASPDVIGWSGEWPDFYSRQQSGPPPSEALESQSSCCRPEPSSCCSQPQQKSSQVRQQAPATPQASCCNGSQLGMPFNFDSEVSDPFVIPEMPMDHFLFPDSMGAFSHQQSTNYATPLPTTGHLGTAVDHNCHCGDSCACIGCATHPQNRTTIEYVRYHNELAMRTNHDGAGLSIQISNPYQQPHVLANSLNSIGPMNGPAFASDVHQSQYYSRFSSMHTPDPGFAMAYSGPAPWVFTNPAVDLHQTPSIQLESFDLHNTPGISQTNEIHGAPYVDHHDAQGPHTPRGQKSRLSHPKLELNDTQTTRDLGTPEAEQAIVDSESLEDDESTSTLSPSSFLPLSVTLEGCDEGACHCGDGCQCAGCLIHRGHESKATPEASKSKSKRRADSASDNFLADLTGLPQLTQNVPG